MSSASSRGAARPPIRHRRATHSPCSNEGACTMGQQFLSTPDRTDERSKNMRTSARGIAIAFAVGACFAPLGAQAMNSGSTGADGAFSPTVSTTVPLPPSGIFNFTTVTIPAGVTVTFQRNTTNTPVVVLAAGDVSIGGSINVSGTPAANTGAAGDGALGDDGVPGVGGPGGFDGGRGGLAGLQRGGAGLGPGGGGGGAIAGGNCTGGFSMGGGGGGFSTAGTSVTCGT